MEKKRRRLRIIPNPETSRIWRVAKYVGVALMLILVVVSDQVTRTSQRFLNLESKHLIHQILENHQYDVDPELIKDKPLADKLNWLNTKLQRTNNLLSAVMANMHADDAREDDTLKYQVLEHYRNYFRDKVNKNDPSHQTVDWGSSSCGLIICIFFLLLIRIICFGWRLVKLMSVDTLKQMCVFLYLSIISMVLFGFSASWVFRLHYNMLRKFLKLQIVEDETHYLFDITRNKIHKQTSAPYFSQTIERHRMEDVILECALLVVGEDGARAIFQSFWWKKKSKTGTDGLQVNVTMQKHITYHKYLIQSTLSLEVLRVRDFDEYSCGYSRPRGAKVVPLSASAVSIYGELMTALNPTDYRSYSPPTSSMTANGKSTANTERGLSLETFALFKLKDSSLLKNPIRVVPGGIFIEHVPYWAKMQPKDRILFNDTVWGEKNLECCSTPAWLYWKLSRYESLVWRDKFGPHFRYFIRQQCICREDFTKRNYVFSRLRNNSVQKNNKMVNIKFPQRWVFIPKLIEPFKCYYDDEEDQKIWMSKEYLDCMESKHSSIVCRQRQNIINSYFTKAEMFNILHSMLFVSVFLVTLGICCFYLLGLYWWVFLPTIKLSLYSFRQNQPRQNFQYDFYMTYDEEDSFEIKVAEILRKELEKLFCVFDIRRDLVPGRPELSAREKAIEQSLGFVVLASGPQDDESILDLEISNIKEVAGRRKVSGDIPRNSEIIFILKTTQCDVETLTDIPHVQLPNTARDNFEIEQGIIDQFLKWAKIMRTSEEELKKLSFLERLRFHGFCWKSVIVLPVLFFIREMFWGLPGCPDLAMAFRKVYFTPEFHH